MMASATLIRDATREDIQDIIRLDNIAGDGMPMVVWQGLAQPGQSPLQVAELLLLQENEDFSYSNARIAMMEDEVAGCLLSYPLSDNFFIPEEEIHSSLFLPMLELMMTVKGYWYVDFLAVEKAFRKRGIGRTLLRDMHERALRHHYSQAALIASDANEAALCLYGKIGFEEVARRKMVKDDWSGAGDEWILMVSGLR